MPINKFGELECDSDPSYTSVYGAGGDPNTVVFKHQESQFQQPQYPYANGNGNGGNVGRDGRGNGRSNSSSSSKNNTSSAAAEYLTISQNGGGKNPNSAGPSSPSAPRPCNAAGAAALGTLEKEVEVITKKLDKMRDMKDALGDLQLKYMEDNDKRVKKKIESTINAINKQALDIKEAMGRFEKNTIELQCKGNIQQNIIEMRKNQHQNFGKKLVEITKETWTKQKDHERKRTQQAAKRLKVRFADANNGEGMPDSDAQRLAQRLVESGNDDQLFLLARDELERALATKEAVSQIESDMRELYQMFCDLNVLVVEQGQMVTEIETSVNKTTKNLVKGNAQLKQAKRHQKACLVM